MIGYGLASSLAKADDKRAVLLHASLDSTRSMYKEINRAYLAAQAEQAKVEGKANAPIFINMSHAGSAAQSRAVIAGLAADVVSLGTAADIDVIAERSDKLAKDWQQRLPNNSSPFSSTVVFLVRKSNPKAIKDWADLVDKDRPVTIITTNPRTSGGARWVYLALWAWASRAYQGDEVKIKQAVQQFYQNAPVLETAARGATTSFAMKSIGDVLVGWESEALFTQRQFDRAGFEIIWPSLSIKAETPVAVIEGNAKAKETLDLARDYSQFLYSPQAQMIAAKNFFRPSLAEVAAQTSQQFPTLDLVTIEEAGGWPEVQAKHFRENGLFDQLSQANRR